MWDETFYQQLTSLIRVYGECGQLVGISGGWAI